MGVSSKVFRITTVPAQKYFNRLAEWREELDMGSKVFKITTVPAQKYLNRLAN